MKNINNSKSSLLKCALTLFSEKGYESTGISEIVSAAGVTKPTLYYFFGSKEGLFKELLNKYYGVLNNELLKSAYYEPIPKAYEQDMYLTLIKIVNSFFCFAEQYKEFYLMVLSFTFAPPTGEVAAMVKPHITEQYTILINSFKEMSKVHGNLVGKETKYAQHFMAMINSAINIWYKGDCKLDDDMVITIVRLFLHGALA